MLKKILHFILIVLLSSIIYHLSSKISYAADYKSDYQAEYFLTENNGALDTKVQLSIRITNLRSDIYVSRFAISFPKSFVIKNLKAFDDNGEITPGITVDDVKTKIDLEFSKAHTGKESVNTFNLQFNQEGLFEVNGNVWEVILPTIENPPSSLTWDGQAKNSYKIIVNLPLSTDKKISIAKPKPTLISNNQIIWENPSTKTVYAVFGDSQIYNLNLSYHLKNTGLLPVYTDVAFPPDRLNQKIIVSSINPKPALTYTDEDGNFLGRYLMKPKETVSVAFLGSAEIIAKPREEVLSAMRSSFSNQSKYLLTEQKYWQSPQVSLKDVSTSGIYQYVVNTLQYDYKRVNSKSEKRLGAIGAVQQPNKAVCVEFTDLFIALARENGIYSREVEGYGFSKDPQLRPLSLITDILHSWPEYYDTGKELWIELDPTWENTSGIDYFNSFDLNHIAFVVHGRRSDYPLPAGMYKIEDSRDVAVVATKEKPVERKQATIIADSIPSQINDNKPVKAKITLVNSGNIFLWNLPVEISSEALIISNNRITIGVLAPYEKKDIDLIVSSRQKNKKINTSIEILVAGRKEFSEPIVVIPFVYGLTLKISGVVGLVAFLILLVKLYRIFRTHER
jgi:hypothetical protein